MKLSRIENHIKKQGKCLTAITAFMGLGIAAVGASVDWTATASSILILPIALDAWALRFLVSDGKGFKPGPCLYEPFFMKSMAKWIKNHIDSTEDLVEKKYRVVCLNLWMRHKNIDLEKLIMPGENLFNGLTSKLREAKETRFPLELLFHKYTERMEKVYGEHITPQSFLNEDKDNPEKIAIAKKVYQEYAETGMAAKAFLSWTDPTPYLFLQDYKFSSVDYEIIKNYTKKINKNANSNKYFYDIYVEEKNKLINEVVACENNIKNLKILGEYYKKSVQSQENKDGIEEMMKKIEVKIAYLELGGEIQEKVDDSNQVIKRKTKKI